MFKFGKSGIWSDKTTGDVWAHGCCFNPQNTIPKVKHGGQSLFAVLDTGNFVCVEGIMEKEDYADILKDNAKKYAAKLAIGHH